MIEARTAPSVSGARRTGDSATPPEVLDGVVERRGLAVVAITVVAFSLVLDGSLSWLVAALLGGGVLLAGHAATGGTRSPAAVALRGARSIRTVTGRLGGLESGLIAGVLAAGLVLAARVVPMDWILLAVLAADAAVLGWIVSVEQRLAATDAGGEYRWQVVLAALAAGFIGFAGVAAMLPGGLGEPAGAMGEGDLLLLAAGDAVIAGLLGFRLVRLGPATRSEALLSAASYAGVVALGAGLLRAMAIPQLLGPALLTLLFFLWDAFHATTPSIRHDPRWRWQVVLLLLLSAVVVGWNLQLRG